MSNDFYFKVPAKKNLKLKTSVSMKLPLFKAYAYGGITLSNTEKSGTKNHDISFEALYRDFDSNQMAEFVSRTIVPKAIRYAIGYHYLGYPLVNYSNNPDTGDQIQPYFGATSNTEFGLPLDVKGGDLGSYGVIAANAGLPSDKLDEYLNELYVYLGGYNASTQGYYNSRVDPITQQVNYDQSTWKSEAKKSLSFGDYKQPLNETWAKLWDPGSSTAMKGSNVPTGEDLDEYGVMSIPITPIEKYGALSELVGPFATTPWYFQNDGSESEKSFANTNIVSAFKLAPTPNAGDSGWDAMAYMLSPNLTIDKATPKIFDYIINIQDGPQSSAVSKLKSQGKGPLSSQNLQGLKDSKPLKFNITALDNSSIGQTDSTVPGGKIITAEDFNSLGYTRILGGFGGNSYKDILSDKKSELPGGIIGKKGNDLTIIPRDKDSLKRMIDFIRKGRVDALGITDNGFGGKIDPNLVYDGTIGTVKVVSVVGDKNKGNKDSVNQFNQMWKVILDSDFNNWERMKWLSDAFLISLYKQIPYGTSNATEKYGDVVGSNIGITFGGEYQYVKDGVKAGPLNLAKVNAVSDLLFPIWAYDKDLLSKINYKRIIDANKPSDLEKYADEIKENQEVLLQENVGTPDWVNGFQIYPSISPEYIGAGLTLAQSGLDTKLDQSPQVKGSVSANLSEWKGYKGGMNWDGSAGLPWMGFGIDDANDPYIELRYVLELEIDETKLIPDMIRQGIFSLAGNSEQYTEAGFDIDELVLATGGKVYNSSLESAYADALSKQTGPTIDFSEFPFLVTGETAAGQILPNEIYLEAQKVVDKNPQDKNPVTSVIFSKDGNKTVPIKVAPGIRAKNLGYMDNLTLVKVTKEWVNGKGDYNEIEIVDLRSSRLGEKGYIDPKDLVDLAPSDTPVYDENGNIKILTIDYPKFFNKQFKDEGYKLAKTEILPMSEMARALVPTWWKNEEPYYNREEGAYYYSVNMPYDCIIDDVDLESKKIEAVKKGFSELLDFYGRQYEPSEIDKLSQTYLAASYQDFHMDLRPGSSLKILIKVGGIYLKAFPTLKDQLNQLKQESDKIISLDAPFYSQHLEQAVFGMNKMYIDLFASAYQIKGFNLLKEAQRLSDVQPFIKKLIILNGFDLTKQGDHVINLGFNDSYDLIFVSYKEQGSTEKLLTIGFNYFKVRTPFIDKTTMALFYYHRRLRNPSLTWQKMVEEILPDPKPEIIAKENSGQFDFPSGKCAPPSFSFAPFSDIIDGLANQLDHALDLNPRFDLGAFEFSLRKFFPPCPKPPPGKGNPFFKTIIEVDGEQNLYEDFDFLMNLTKERDRISDYVGDFLTSAEALKDINDKIFDLDDLHKHVTSMIDLPTLYSTICRCFLDLAGIDEVELPNLEIKASGGSAGASLSPALQGKGKDEILDLKGPEGSYSTDPITMDAGDLYCSFCLEIPELYLRLPTTNILEALLDALKKLLEFILSQLLLELIAALLEVLQTCPDIQCPPGQATVKDYGGQDFNSIFDQSGVPTDEFFINCGVTGSPEEIQIFLAEVSKVISSGEVLDLIAGTPSIEVLQTIDKVLTGHPSIKAQITTKAQIEDFFTCAGNQLPIEIIDGIEKDITDIFKDPEICKDLFQDAKDQLKKKCGTEDNSNKIAARASGADVAKYKQLADIIRKQSDLSTQLPPLFGDGKGNLGLMSGMNSPTMDYAIEQTVDSLILPIEVSLTRESRAYTKGGGKRGMVIEDPDLRYVTGLPSLAAISAAIFLPDMKNKLVNNVDSEAFGQISKNTFINTLNNSVKLKVDENNSVSLFLKPPVSDQNAELIYTDNFALSIKDERFGNFIINPTSMGGISEERQKILNRYPLFESGEYCEQSQYFGNLFLKGLGFAEEINDGEGVKIDIDDSPAVDPLRRWASKSLYFSLFKTLFRDISETIADGELLKTYDASPFDEIEPGVFKSIIDKLSSMFPPPLEIEDLLPDLSKRELEQVDLTPVDSNVNSSTPQGLINFPLVKDIIKKNYDFGEFYDPNSKELGMPHFAMLEGIMAATVQLFVGEFFAKSIFVISKIPINYFTDDYSLVDIITKEVELYLNRTENAKFKSVFKELSLRLISRKSEWSFSDPDKTNFDDPGTVYDTALGKEMYIDTWQSATKYFIRQHYKVPIIFLKDRLNKTKLKDNGVIIAGDKKIEQLNPLSSLSYPNMLEIYSEVSNVDIGASSICDPERINDFKDGKFFYQYYYEVIDFEPEDYGYNESIIKYRKDNGYDGLMSAQNLSNFFRDLYTIDVFTTILTGKIADLQINSIFKDVRMGVRYCYGYAYTEALVVTQGGDLDTVMQSAILKEISQDMQNLISGKEPSDVSGFQDLSSDSLDYLQDKLGVTSEKNKSLVLRELHGVAKEEGIDSATRYSYIFPFFNKSSSIKNWNAGMTSQSVSDKVTFDKTLYEIAHGLNTNDSLAVLGPLLSNFGDLINEDRIRTIAFDLLVEMIKSEDFQLLYKYCFSIPKILYTLSIYNNLAVSSQSGNGMRVNDAFLNTKNSIKDTILNIYKIGTSGSEAYKQQPDSITDQGGSSGIAKSSIKGAP